MHILWFHSWNFPEKTRPVWGWIIGESMMVWSKLSSILIVLLVAWVLTWVEFEGAYQKLILLYFNWWTLPHIVFDEDERWVIECVLLDTGNHLTPWAVSGALTKRQEESWASGTERRRVLVSLLQLPLLLSTEQGDHSLLNPGLLSFTLESSWPPCPERENVSRNLEVLGTVWLMSLGVCPKSASHLMLLRRWKMLAGVIRKSLLRQVVLPFYSRQKGK